MSLKITQISGTGVAIPGDDIDTDRVIPARFLKEITFAKMGDYLFNDVRFEGDRTPKAHPLNDPKYKGASILIVGRNFGCGSSREHAPQAIKRYGIAAIIGESFAEIFQGNCKNVGLPAVTVTPEDRAFLEALTQSAPHTEMTIDLEAQKIEVADQQLPLQLADAFRQAFLTGYWDSAAILEANKEKIAETEQKLPYEIIAIRSC